MANETAQNAAVWFVARSIRFACRWLLVLSGVYVMLVVILGIWQAKIHPVSPGGAAGYVPIFVADNGMHIDFIVPQRVALVSDGNEVVIDWSRILAGGGFLTSEAVPEPTPQEPRVWQIFGWGHRAFYTSAPSWSDITLSVVGSTLTGSSAAMHVDTLHGDLQPEPSLRRIELNYEQYLILSRFIESTLSRTADGHFIRLPGTGYTATDSFYAANGTFSPFYTCNTWVVDALYRIGVPTARWTPFSWFVMYHLPEQ